MRANLKARRVPTALTVAGSDSGGGAGIQADLKTFATLGVHGTSVITCLTAQNPKAVLGVMPATPESVTEQLTAVFAELRPAAIKTGMMFSRRLVEAVASFLKRNAADIPLIVDPVMVATSGAMLLDSSAIDAIKKSLLPRAVLITPNIPEAEALTGMAIRDPENMRAAARWLRSQFGCGVLLKGGHLKMNKAEAIDIFFDGGTELLLSAPFVRGVSTHGTGCTYSAAIAGAMAQGNSLKKAVSIAKELISGLIASSNRVQDHDVLGWLSKRSR